MFTRRRTALAATAALTLTLAACGDDGDSADGGDGGEGTEFITIATGGSSGPYYQIGATMSQVLADELGSDTSVQSTGASVENINLLADGDAELAFAMGDATRQAMDGTGPFEDAAHEDLQSIGALYPNFVQVVTVEGSGIESIEDLAGQRVGVGDVNSGVELNAQMILEAHDMSYDDIDEDFLSYAEAIDQMRNGQVKAAFVTSGLPNASVTDLATGENVVTVPITGEGREKLLELYPFFSEDVIPGGTYSEDEDVDTVSITNQLLVSNELSEDAVYDITAALFDNIDQIHAAHNAANDITADTVEDGMVAPMHPGAKRYFDEQR